MERENNRILGNDARGFCVPRYWKEMHGIILIVFLVNVLPTMLRNVIRMKGTATRNSNIHEHRVTEIGGDVMVMNAEISQNTNNGLTTLRYSELMNNLNPCLEICNPAGLQLPLETNVEQLITYGIALPKPVQAKVVKYYLDGDFATATEHVWPRAISILRRRILSLGEEFVADMVETTDLEYVRELPAYKVIELANELGFIDKKGKGNFLMLMNITIFSEYRG